MTHVEWGVKNPQGEGVIPCPHWTLKDAQAAQEEGLHVMSRIVTEWGDA